MKTVEKVDKNATEAVVSTGISSETGKGEEPETASNSP